MTDFNLPWKASQETRSTSWGIKAHSRSSSDFKLSSEPWGVLQTLLSRIDHTENSRWLKSRLFEGHSSLLMNAGSGLNPALSHFGAMWRSRVLLQSPRCTIQVLTCPVNQFSFQNVRNVISECFCTLSFTPEGTKMSGDLPVAVIAAHTITDCGFWRRLTLLPSTDSSLLQTLLPSTDPSLLQTLLPSTDPSLLQTL